jgi:hypothetical protein
MEIFKNEIPDFILNDDSYLFHGSSNLNEQNLDNGFTNGNTTISFDIIEKIISVYQEMTWSGNHGGGYAILSTFSVCDKKDDEKYFFLGETPKRCSLYSTSDFAGGELVRSVYYSLKDLEKYLTNSELRKKHKSDLIRDFRLYGKIYDVDLKRLENQVNSFKSILSDLEHLRNGYKYGIIYCYNIKKEDYTNLVHRGSMGVIVKDALPKERLVAKLIFTPPVEEYFGKSLIDELRFERHLIWSERLKNG